MYVCICHAITDKDVRSAESKGAATEADVFDHYGVAPRCGRCLSSMRCMMSCERAEGEPCMASLPHRRASSHIHEHA